MFQWLLNKRKRLAYNHFLNVVFIQMLQVLNIDKINESTSQTLLNYGVRKCAIHGRKYTVYVWRNEIKQAAF